MPDVSIVIPCFNSGEFLPEAIESIRKYTGINSCEIIIVDDGSTDEKTINLLNTLAKSECKTIRQENQGPAAARNAGVHQATSEFILFLDSDNKIRSNTFIDQALKVFIEDKSVGVVYGNAVTFGTEGANRFTSSAFNLEKLLISNYIDMCCMIRKQVLQEVKGLDENRLIIGHEDWELWLRIAKTKWKFHYCEQIFFDYRIREDSLITQASRPEQYQKAKKYILSKHADLLSITCNTLFQKYQTLDRIYQDDMNKPIRSFIKFFLLKLKKLDSYTAKIK